MKFWIKRTSDTSVVIHTEDPSVTRMYCDPDFQVIGASSAPCALDRFLRWEWNRHKTWLAVISFFNGDDITTAGLRIAGLDL